LIGKGKKGGGAISIKRTRKNQLEVKEYPFGEWHKLSQEEVDQIERYLCMKEDGRKVKGIRECS